MEVLTMRVAIDTCQARHGFYGLSFWGDNGLSVEQIVQLAGLEHPRIRVSTIGRIRQLGLEPVRLGRFPHLTIKFELPPTDEELRALAEVFDPPTPNPAVARNATGRVD